MNSNFESTLKNKYGHEENLSKHFHRGSSESQRQLTRKERKALEINE